MLLEDCVGALCYIGANKGYQVVLWHGKTYQDIFPVLARQVLVSGLEHHIIEGVRLGAKHSGYRTARGT